MLFNVLPSLAALASFAIAAPTPSQTSLDTPLDAPVDIKARAADPPGGPITCYGGPPCITDGGEGSACIISQWVTKGAAHAWVVGIPVSSVFKVRQVWQSSESAAGRVGP